MKQKRRVINFILSVVCCLYVFFGSGMESRASDVLDEYLGYEVYTFTKNGREYVFVYTDHVWYGNNDYVFDEPMFVIVCRTGTNGNMAFVSSEYLEYTYNGISGQPLFESDNIFKKEFYGTGYDKEFNIPVNTNSDPGFVIRAFLEYAKTDGYDLINRFEPDFDNYYHEDQDIYINDMKAEVSNNTLYSTWNGLAGTGSFMLEGYENTYIQLYLTFVDDKGTEEIEDDKHWNPKRFFTKLPPNEFSVSLSEFDVPMGYRLQFMIAVPYWYFNDDVKSTMFRGKITYLFFDEEGISEKPLIKNPDDIYNPLDPDYSNWNALTNFTGSYFNKMNNVMNNTFNSWDGSVMGSDNDKLGNALSGYSQHEEVIINQVSSNIRNFDFDNYLTFSDKVNAGISFGSMLINKFFVESGDFTILFVVGCIMVFLFVVVGIWRFSK